MPPKPSQTPQTENKRRVMPARPRCFLSNSSLFAAPAETAAASSLGLEIVEKNQIAGQ